MLFCVVTGCNRRLAVTMVLGVVVMWQCLPMLAAYGVPRSAHAAGTDGRSPVQALPASRTEREGAASSTDRKPSARVAQLFDDRSWDDRPARDEEDRPRPQTYRTLCV